MEEKDIEIWQKMRRIGSQNIKKSIEGQKYINIFCIA